MINFLYNNTNRIAIFLLTKFHLNANSSFKVVCWIRYRTDYKAVTNMLPPLESITRQTLTLKNS